MELVLQFPPMDGEAEDSRRFAVRVHGDEMHATGRADDFKPGEVVVFSSGYEVKSGDYAYVLTNHEALFRQVQFNGSEHIKLIPLNTQYMESSVPKDQIRQMWKLVRHVRDCVNA
jgi:SOS-response transcriptional repressor LexA